MRCPDATVRGMERRFRLRRRGEFVNERRGDEVSQIELQGKQKRKSEDLIFG